MWVDSGHGVASRTLDVEVNVETGIMKSKTTIKEVMPWAPVVDRLLLSRMDREGNTNSVVATVMSGMVSTDISITAKAIVTIQGIGPEHCSWSDKAGIFDFL